MSEEVIGEYWLCAGDCGQWCKGMPAAHNGSGPVCHDCEWRRVNINPTSDDFQEDNLWWGN